MPSLQPDEARYILSKRDDSLRVKWIRLENVGTLSGVGGEIGKEAGA